MACDKDAKDKGRKAEEELKVPRAGGDFTPHCPQCNEHMPDGVCPNGCNLPAGQVSAVEAIGGGKKPAGAVPAPAAATAQAAMAEHYGRAAAGQWHCPRCGKFVPADTGECANCTPASAPGHPAGGMLPSGAAAPTAKKSALGTQMSFPWPSAGKKPATPEEVPADAPSRGVYHALGRLTGLSGLTVKPTEDGGFVISGPKGAGLGPQGITWMQRLGLTVNAAGQAAASAADADRVVRLAAAHGQSRGHFPQVWDEVLLYSQPGGECVRVTRVGKTVGVRPDPDAPTQKTTYATLEEAGQAMAQFRQIATTQGGKLHCPTCGRFLPETGVCESCATLQTQIRERLAAAVPEAGKVRVMPRWGGDKTVGAPQFFVVLPSPGADEFTAAETAAIHAAFPGVFETAASRVRHYQGQIGRDFKPQQAPPSPTQVLTWALAQGTGLAFAVKQEPTGNFTLQSREGAALTADQVAVLSRLGVGEVAGAGWTIPAGQEGALLEQMRRWARVRGLACGPLAQRAALRDSAAVLYAAGDSATLVVQAAPQRVLVQTSGSKGPTDYQFATPQEATAFVVQHWRAAQAAGGQFHCPTCGRFYNPEAGCAYCQGAIAPVQQQLQDAGVTDLRVVPLWLTTTMGTPQVVVLPPPGVGEFTPEQQTALTMLLPQGIAGNKAGGPAGQEKTHSWVLRSPDEPSTPAPGSRGHWGGWGGAGVGSFGFTPPPPPKPLTDAEIAVLEVQIPQYVGPAGTVLRPGRSPIDHELSFYEYLVGAAEQMATHLDAKTGDGVIPPAVAQTVEAVAAGIAELQQVSPLPADDAAMLAHYGAVAADLQAVLAQVNPQDKSTWRAPKRVTPFIGTYPAQVDRYRGQLPVDKHERLFSRLQDAAESLAHHLDPEKGDGRVPAKVLDNLNAVEQAMRDLEARGVTEPEMQMLTHYWQVSAALRQAAAQASPQDKSTWHPPAQLLPYSTEFYMAGYPKRPAFGGVVVNAEGKVLMREPKGHFAGYAWSLPKGGAVGEESPEQAALREVQEEGGVEGEIIAPLPGVFMTAGTATSYYVMGVKKDTGVLDDETAQVRWVTVDEALDLVRLNDPAGCIRDRRVLLAYKAWLDEQQGKKK